MTSKPSVSVVFASVTGTCADVAFSCVQALAHYSDVVGVELHDIGGFSVHSLPLLEYCVFIVSTTGDGEMPPSAAEFWRFLLRADLPAGALSKLSVAVFGAGDSGYVKFNAAARKLDTRLRQLGARSLCERCLGDEQSPNGVYGDFDTWMQGTLLPALKDLFPAMNAVPASNAPRLMPCRYRVSILRGAAAAGLRERDAPLPPSAAVRVVHGSNASADEPAAGDAPVMCRVRSCMRMTADDWSQDVRHIDIDTSGTSLRYEAGDVAVVHVRNSFDGCSGAVTALVGRMSVALNDVLRIEAADAGEPTLSASYSLAAKVDSDATNGINWDPCTVRPELVAAATSGALAGPMPTFPRTVTVQTLFDALLDIRGVPRRSFFQQVSFFASDAEQRDKLLEMSTAAGADLYHMYCTRERRSYVDVLLDFPSIALPLPYLLQLVPPLAPREFSIASAPETVGACIQLCVAVVEFTTRFKRRIVGTGSSYIASRNAGDELLLRVRAGTMRLPRADVPLVLIGPGTGIAPMRALLQQHRALVARQRTSPDGAAVASALPRTTLLGGCRHRDKDWLYRDEMRAWAREGGTAPAAYDVAFSRDQEKKVYVQTLLRARYKDAVARALLHEGGYLFIAGSAKRMPSDVLDAVKASFEEVGGMTAGDASKLIARLERERRIVVEAWS